MALFTDATLGPLRFATVVDKIREQFGESALEAVGPVLRPGERRARAFNVTLPVRGDRQQSAFPRDQALLLRRQVRALMENSAARLQGLYFSWAADTEQNGWLLVGQADLEEAEGGVTAGEWKLVLSDCYRVATIRSHREARRAEVFDRRVATTPLDVLGRVFSSGFTGTARATLALPASASDLTTTTMTGDQLVAGTETRDGVLTVLDPAAGAVVAFERDPALIDATDAAAYLPGAAAVTASLLVPADAERILGPVQSLPVAPTSTNGRCRVRWLAAQGVLAIDGVDGVEACRVLVVVGAGGIANTLLSQQVVEATPERVVLRLRVGTTGSTRADVYVTLQRGWAGPRVEAYAVATTGPVAAALRVVPAAAGAVTYTRDGDTGSLPAATVGAWTGMGPSFAFTPATGRSLVGGVARAGDTLSGVDDTAAYGATRRAPQVAGATAGYVGLTVEPVDAAAAAGRRLAAGQESLMDARGVRELVAR